MGGLNSRYTRNTGEVANLSGWRVSLRYRGEAGASWLEEIRRVHCRRILRFVHSIEITPYLKGGTGIYYTTLGTEPTSDVLTPSQLALYPNGFYQNGFSVGANVGLGIKARFGSRELFIEQMLHAFDIGRLSGGIYPFNIGIRF